VQLSEAVKLADAGEFAFDHALMLKELIEKL